MSTTLSSTYTKPALSISKQIEMLKNRGLKISDDKWAEKLLEDISYFRIVAYLRPMEADHTAHKFKPNSSLEKAYELYSFDKKLRILVFTAIQTIEISLRSRIIHHFSIGTTPFWFFDESLCNDKHNYLDNMYALERELNRSKDDFIKEHKIKYGSNSFPPAWKILELASFGCLTKLFFNFKSTRIKKRIARSYGVPQHVILESWMKNLCAIRNVCAHHGRLWNRVIPIKPLLPDRMSKAWIKNTAISQTRLYAGLCCIQFWLNSIEPENTFKQDFKALLAAHHNVDPAAIGFPANWEKEPLWN
jgi:abortive infection bacteriophage resistance protein